MIRRTRKTCSLELHGNMGQYATVIDVFHTLFLLPIWAFPEGREYLKNGTPAGLSPEGELIPTNGTPERLSLSGSHGQRPWVYAH
jgi:hypothetical protein